METPKSESDFFQPSDLEELQAMTEEWAAMDSLASLGGVSHPEGNSTPTDRPDLGLDDLDLPEGFADIPGIDWSFLE